MVYSFQLLTYDFAVMRSLHNPQLLGVSVVLSLAFLPLAVFGFGAAATLCKVGSIALLIVAAKLAKTPAPLLAALSFSALGDLFLELNRVGQLGPDEFFMLGLGSFLLAHLSYIALFLKNRAKPPVSNFRRLATILIIIWAVVLLNLLWNDLGALRLPVILYAGALTAMAVAAQQCRFSGVLACGALLFVASDSMLAWQHFRAPFALGGPLVWFSYYFAQVLIVHGVSEGPQRQQAGT